MNGFIKAIGGRRVLLSIITILIAFSNAYWNLGMNIQELLIAASGPIAFVLGESAGDALERLAGGKLIQRVEDLANLVEDATSDEEGEDSE